MRRFLIACAIVLLQGQQLAAQDCGGSYTVRPGDTLSDIAQAAYGTFDYQSVFNANRNLIANPNTLETGIALQLPCEDGSLPTGVSAREIIAREEAEQMVRPQGSSAFEPPIRIVSANGWAPAAKSSPFRARCSAGCRGQSTEAQQGGDRGTCPGR